MTRFILTNCNPLREVYFLMREQSSGLDLTWPWTGFPAGSVGKDSACNAGDLGSIPGLGRFPGEGNGNPLQYSCLENPMDRGAWQAIVHRVTRVGHDLVTKPSPPPLSYFHLPKYVPLSQTTVPLGLRILDSHHLADFYWLGKIWLELYFLCDPSLMYSEVHAPWIFSCST